MIERSAPMQTSLNDGHHRLNSASEEMEDEAQRPLALDNELDPPRKRLRTSHAVCTAH